jgi:hypothetical protein
MTPSGIEPATYRFVASAFTTTPPRAPILFRRSSNSKQLAIVLKVNRTTERTVRTGILLPSVPRDVDGIPVDDQITHAADITMT